MYGQALRVPGEFFDVPDQKVDRSDFAKQLHEAFSEIRSPQTTHHAKPTVFLHKDLKSCSRVFVRVDAAKRSSQQPYEGPFEVLERGDKFFDVSIAGKQQRISIDRIKPAYTCDSNVGDHPSEDDRTVVTQSGHRVRFLV